VYLVLWALELPLSILRWLTIPSSDGEWDRRRRLWTACTPPFALLLLSAVHADSIPAAFSQTFGTSSMPGQRSETKQRTAAHQLTHPPPRSPNTANTASHAPPPFSPAARCRAQATI
jgi:hypothetical protein